MPNFHHLPTFSLVTLLSLNSIACNWVDATGRQDNEAPTINISVDGKALGNSNIIKLYNSNSKVIDFSGSHDTDGNIVEYKHTLLNEGKLDQCTAVLSSSNNTANNLIDACNDESECSFSILSEAAASDNPNSEASSSFTIIPPAVQRSVGLTYRWTAIDNDGAQSHQDITYCILPDNPEPEAIKDSYQIGYGESLSINGISYSPECGIESGASSVLGNDSLYRISDHCLTAELISIPEMAANDFQASFTSSGGFIYHHNGEVFSNKDSFSYQAFDGEKYSTVVAVDILIDTSSNTPPTAKDDVFEVEMNSKDNTLYPLNNDTDLDNFELRIDQIIKEPSQGGSVSIQPEGYLSYTPAKDFFGTEEISYQISDIGGLVSSANITITIDNSIQIAVDDSFTISSTWYWTYLNVLDNDNATPNSKLTIIAIDDSNLTGTLLITRYGKSVIYQAQNGFHGRDQFTYTVIDTFGVTSTATVTITVP